jgi:hypothetical protein
MSKELRRWKDDEVVDPEGRLDGCPDDVVDLVFSSGLSAISTCLSPCLAYK